VTTLHAGIFGPTNCGKTTLARALCGAFEKKGIKTLVLDPYDSDWPATWQTRNMPDFLVKAKNSRGCALFVDEAGQLNMRDPAHAWLVTVARKWGHISHIIGQTGVQLSPLGRGSITRLYLFRSTEETSDYWAKVFVDDRIRQASGLKQFEFLTAEMFGDVRLCRLEMP
jgi:GTPase SAR1 family protein